MQSSPWIKVSIFMRTCTFAALQLSKLKEYFNFKGSEAILKSSQKTMSKALHIAIKRKLASTILLNDVNDLPRVTKGERHA